MIDAPILLIEDNPDDVALTRRAFAGSGVGNEIVVLTDGEHLLDRLHPANGTSPLRPAFVLLDIDLPKTSGLEVLRRIRADARTRLLPVIMLTTSADQRAVTASYRLGANSFVRKPVAYRELLHIVRTLSLYWLGVNVPSAWPEETP